MNGIVFFNSLLFRREGGVDLIGEAAGAYGRAVNGKEGEATARYWIGWSQIFFGAAGGAATTKLGKVPLRHLPAATKEALKEAFVKMRAKFAPKTNLVTNEGVPASRVGTGRAISIYGEREAAGAGFTDVATEARFANGRPLTSTQPNGSASDLALRDAPLSATTRAEMQRLAQPGARITYANADVEGFQTYVDQLRQTFRNARVVLQGTVTDAKGVKKGVVVLELP